MARKKKRLPKDFGALLGSGDLAAMKAVFDTTELDAHDGAYGPTALGMPGVPPELVAWLVEQGADIDAADHYGTTPLCAHARSGNDAVIVALLDAGADLQSTREPVLHAAADSAWLSTVALLLDRGADPLAEVNGLTALASALQRCSNADLSRMADVAQALLEAGTPITDQMRSRVTAIGKRFEFYRASFNPDSLPEADAALNRLYTLFQVEPVSPRRTNDGTSPITVVATAWSEQHRELWNHLVPGSGPAATAQGEAIRITGRLAHEVLDNGGINWDRDCKTMARTLPALFASGVPLPEDQLAEATILAASYRATSDEEHAQRLSELAVTWVLANPGPLPTPEPAYTR